MKYRQGARANLQKNTERLESIWPQFDYDAGIGFKKSLTGLW